MRDLRALSLALLVAPLVTPPAWSQRGLKEPKSFEEAVAQFEVYRQMQALHLHSLAWARLGRTKDARALPLLIEEHGEKRNPRQVRRHLLTSIVARHFTDEASVDPLVAWRTKNAAEEDAWLWCHTLWIEARHRGPDAALAVLRDKKSSLPMRGAAIEALGRQTDPAALYTAIEETVKVLPKKPYEKAILVGAMGTALERHRTKVKSREFKVACSYFINLLNDEFALETTTKLVIARALGRILDTDELVVNAAPWIALLGDQKAGKSNVDELGYVKPTFFGVEASGTRICYVIDMSDSMCRPVDVPEELKSGPVSGGGEDAKGPKIPWHQVETRFDLAREQLKLSLRTLDEDALFAVVYFGDDGELLESCKGMSKASKGAVKKVVKELDSIEMDEPSDTRPDGQLRGKTNLHGGLRTAFRIKKKGVTEEHSYVDPKVFAEGADTIFLLSDGAPSWDDYGVWDDNMDEMTSGDPESGVKGGEGNRTHYSGPYRNQNCLIEDVERLNLFREVEIHCISIGEASRGLLEKLAEIGHGSVTELGV